jgi:hypothetical protein
VLHVRGDDIVGGRQLEEVSDQQVLPNPSTTTTTTTTTIKIKIKIKSFFLT